MLTFLLSRFNHNKEKKCTTRTKWKDHFYCGPGKLSWRKWHVPRPGCMDGIRGEQVRWGHSSQKGVAGCHGVWWQWTLDSGALRETLRHRRPSCPWRGRGPRAECSLVTPLLLSPVAASLVELSPKHQKERLVPDLHPSSHKRFLLST